MYLTWLLPIFPLLTGVCANGASVKRQSDSNSTTSATTDQSCSTDMCVSSSTNATTVQYTLAFQGSGALGWMALGFGTQMIGSQMVIIWANDDGTFTLSQREASGHFEPAVVDNPERVATLSQDLSSASGDIKFAFTVDADSTTQQSVVYAYSSIKPSTSEPGATLNQHDTTGGGSLNVAAPSSGGDNGDTGSGDDSESPPDSTSEPLLKYQKMIVAHGIMCVLGFLLFLPVGSLWARYVRTLAPRVTWFNGHFLIQFGIALPIIVSGVALGIAAVSEVGGPHLSRTHQKWGVAIFVLYFVQLLGGSVIHWIKPAVQKQRPAQNYGHAVLGIFIIAISFYQVRTGYRSEWPAFSGLDGPGRGADIVWYIWVVLIPVLYFVGLGLLPKQYRMEAESRASSSYVRSTGSS